MPSLGADMEDGVLAEWKVGVGDEVHRGDIIAVVETQKGAIEIEVFVSGRVHALEVEEGARVPVGTTLALIADQETGKAPIIHDTIQEEEIASSAPAPSPPQPAGVAPARPSPPRSSALGPPPVAASHTESWVRSSPAARRRAHELGVELSQVHGTGPHGAVNRQDVERAAEEAPASAEPPAPPVATPVAPPVAAPAVDPMRAAIAAAMSRSNRDIPHYYLAHQLDLEPALRWLEEQNRGRPLAERVLPAALLIKASAMAMAKVPELNGTWVDGAFRPAAGIHPGVAVSLRGGGLVTPALHDADQLSLDEVMQKLSDLVERARAGRLRGSELSDPTFTLTNLGDTGCEVVYGVIYPPQVALLGFGRIVERPWAVDGLLGVRRVVTVTLAADHRASDGHQGARLLGRLERLLQKPQKLA